MNKRKQTAVEFLEEQIRLCNIDCLRFQLWDSVEQAKEMEKKQQGYSEEEVYNLLYKLLPDEEELNDWFKQFKKK